MSEEETPGCAPEDGDSVPDDQIDLEEALREKDQFRRLAQRAQADLVNYRRRATAEIEEVRRRASADILLKVIGVVDDLERALDMVPEDAVASGWLEGLNLVMRKMEGVLETSGVQKIEALGRPFEPWQLEAVHYAETSEYEPGVVTEVFREGYMLNDMVLRAAQVVIAKEPEPPAQADTSVAEPVAVAATEAAADAGDACATGAVADAEDACETEAVAEGPCEMEAVADAEDATEPEAAAETEDAKDKETN
jgi:molecular chaperone GrpE